jgi:hypothetical protein
MNTYDLMIQAKSIRNLAARIEKYGSADEATRLRKSAHNLESMLHTRSLAAGNVAHLVVEARHGYDARK